MPDFHADWSKIHLVASQTGAKLALRTLAAQGTPRAVIQFNHGAAEHAGRYGEFAEKMSAAGFHFLAHDHRGHGKTEGDGVTPHMFGKKGWDLVIEDMGAIHRHIDEQYADLPRTVMGHSMGSVASFEFMLQNPDRAQAMALLGPTLQKTPLMPVLRFLLSAEDVIRESYAYSPLFQSMVWTPFNKPFEPSRTPFDWLSRDEAQVDAYVKDEDCGWPPTVNFAREISRGIAETYKDDRLSALNTALPVLLMSGTQDPSTEYGKSVPELSARLKAAGLKNIDTEIFADMRHELHNETDSAPVFERLTAWCHANAH